MNKIINPTVLKKAAKSALAIVLAGSFAFAGTNAFADSNDSSTNQTTTQLPTSTDTSTSVSTQESVAPSLLPGDFFYFAKIAFEKIQLALTFDQTKEAKLLASNASERLAEAQALYASGDQQKAVDTLKSALDDMNSAQKIVEKEDEQPVDSAKSTSSTTEDSSTNKDSSATEESATTKDSSTPEDSPEIKDVKDQLTQNIKALEVALEKGNKSEAAKKALEKNIMKFKAKLAGKNSVATDKNQTTQTVNTNTDQSSSDTTSTDTNATATDTTATGTVTSDTTTSATETPNTNSQETTVSAPAVTTTTTSVTPAASGTTTPSNHGQEVSQVAKQATTQNHGQVVSQVAKSNAGKGNSEKGKH
jgi:hypothetical protein